MTERLDRIEASIEDLTNALDVLVTQFIRPTAQQASANFERLERIESALEQLVTLMLSNEQQIAANTDQIAANASQVAQNAGQIAANASQVAQNAEAITRLEVVTTENAQTVSRLERLFETMLQENRSDRAEWRSRISNLEQAS